MRKLTEEEKQKLQIYASTHLSSRKHLVEPFDVFPKHVTRSLLRQPELLQITADPKTQLGLFPFKTALNKWIKEYHADAKRLNRFIFSFDLETTGLDPRKAAITWLGWTFAVENKHSERIQKKNRNSLTPVEPYSVSGAIPFLHRNPSSSNISIHTISNDLRSIFNTPYITAVTHNGTFDYQMLVEKGVIDLKDIRCLLFDTFVAATLTNPIAPREYRDKPRSLKTLSKKLLGVDQPEYQRLTKNVLFEDVIVDKALNYVVNDVECTYRLFKNLRERISEERPTRNYFYQIEQPHMLTTIELSLSGLPIINPEVLEETVRPARKYETSHLSSAIFHSKLELKIEELTNAMFKVLGGKFNINSPDQLSSALFNSRLGLSPMGINMKSKKRAVDKTTLTKIFKKSKSTRGRLFIALLLKARQLVDAQKRINDLQKGFNVNLGRTYTSFNSGTSSGRYSTSTPNFLGMSSSSGVKNNIIAAEDRIFISSDYEQIDFRVIANESGSIISEKNTSNSIDNASSFFGPMLNNVNSGLDLHLCTLEIFDEKARNFALKKIYKIGDVIPAERIYSKSKDIIEQVSKGMAITISSSVRAYIERNRSDEKVTVTDDIIECQHIEYIEKRRKFLSKPFNFGISYGLGEEQLHENLNNPDDHLEVVIGDENISHLLDLVNKHASAAQEFDSPEIKHQLDQIAKEIAQDEINLDEVKKYYAQFFKNYEGIKEFQEKVEQSLRKDFGRTTTLFGRPVIAEVYHHFSKIALSKSDYPVFDILVKGKYYRLAVKILSIEKRHFNCQLVAAWELQPVPSKRKFFEKAEEMSKRATELIFCLSDEAIFPFQRNSKLSKLSQDELKLLKEEFEQFKNENIERRINLIASAHRIIDEVKRRELVLNCLGEIERIVDKYNSSADYFFENIEVMSLDEILRFYPLGLSTPKDTSEIPLIFNTVRPFIKLKHQSIKTFYPSFFELCQGHEGNKYFGIDKLERNLIATRVQATSMDFCKIAMTNFRRERDKLWTENEAHFSAKNLLPPKLINCVHDDIVIESPLEADSADPIQNKVLNLLKSVMQSKGQKKCPYKKHVMKGKKLLVHIDCGPKVAKRYSDL